MRRISSQRGAALITVLMISAVLVILVTEVMRSVGLYSSMAESFRDGQKAALMAEGGVRTASDRLKELAAKKEPFSGDQGARFVFSEAGGTVVSISVEDEGGKLNLNRTVMPNGRSDGFIYPAYLRLLDGLKLDTALAETLADWIDNDNVPRPGGAEADYYIRLKASYASKGAALDSAEELRLVKGYSAEAYARLKPFVTVYTDGKVNINTASEEVLMSLSGDVTRAIASRAVEYRRKRPFLDPADIRKVPGFETVGFTLQGKLAVKSNIYRIIARAEHKGSVKEAEAVIDLESGRCLYWREW